MKKTAKLLTAALIALVLLLALVSCGGDPTDGTGHTHIYENKRTDIKASVITEATCIQRGEYYYICSCGALGEETYEVDYLSHSYSSRVEDEAHLASDADCTGPRRYYYTCSVCSAVSETETFSSGYPTGHVYENNVCIYGCGTSQNQYTLSADGTYYTLTSFTEDIEIAVIPASYNGLPVKSIGSHAFAGVKVREVVLPASVDTIEKSAFYDDESLEKINLGNVKTIGESAFAFCSSLAEADIGSVVSLGAYSLSRTAITEITIPEGVSEIGECALYDCPALTRINYLATNAADLQYPSSILGKNDGEAAEISLYVGKNVTRIPNSAFSYSRITEIEFAEDSSCRVIGAFAFNNSLGEKTLTLTSVETVGERAFEHSEITELTLGGRINAVKRDAFSFCNKLTKVTIAANRGGFETHAFASCDNLSTLYYLHEGSESIGSAFMGNSVNLVFGKNVKIVPTGFENGGIAGVSFESGSNGVRIEREAFTSSISGVLDLSSVVSIGAYAFHRGGVDAKLDKVIIGKDLESIGTYAFYEVGELLLLAENCADVTAVASDPINAAFLNVGRLTVGKGVTRIPGGMFYYSKIGSVVFETGNTCSSIGDKAFCYSDITTLELPTSVKTIGASAFEGVSGVQSAIDLNSVTRFGVNAFKHYSGEIDVSDSAATELPDGAFYGSGVSGTVLLDSIRRIGEKAFYGCASITRIVFGENFLGAGSDAFALCSGIISVEFNAISAEDLSSAIFSNNSGERSFDLMIGSSATRIPAFIFSDSAVATVTFESDSSCTHIGKNAFADTSRLGAMDLVLPNSVKSIGDGAFQQTMLERVTFGTGIESIGNNAFRAMSINDAAGNGKINEIYFSKGVTLVATKISDGSKETLVFAANSSENALEYAKIFFRSGYTYSLKK